MIRINVEILHTGKVMLLGSFVQGKPPAREHRGTGVWIDEALRIYRRFGRINEVLRI